MKNHLLIRAFLAMCILSTGCTDRPSAPADPGAAVQTVQTEAVQSQTVQHSFPELVKPLGRTYEQDGTLWLAYSGTGAEFIFTGTRFDVTIAGDSSVAGDENSRARIGIFVNGERLIDDMIDAPEKTYTVIDRQTEGALIQIVKLSEAANSVCGIKSADFDGTVSPAPEKDMKIEFIGDSITCGYGVDDENAGHHFSTKTEDCTKAYAVKTAEKLGADYSLVAMSGHGIISGYSDGKIQQKNQVMSRYYDKFGFSYTTFGGTKAYSIDWDHSRFEPDVIVINLGTNDASWCRQEEDRLNDFSDKYIKFITHLREVHPDAKIVCTLGIMGADLYPWIEAAAERYTADSGDKNVYLMRFDTQDTKDGIAADWHPSEKTHEKAADKLAEFIRTIDDK
ncbi:MAG: GDSL family lipase [Oscillospiraceae bacterium]|nr:GDSL family lipase [Oscillospiraceae bacterium]